MLRVELRVVISYAEAGSQDPVQSDIILRRYINDDNEEK